MNWSKNMGIKKGEKRYWDIRIIPEADKINKTISITVSQNNIDEAKSIKEKLNVTYREIFIAGIKALKEG